MNEETYRIIDDGTNTGVHIFAPDGSEITECVFQYLIIRQVHKEPLLRLQVRDAERKIVNGEPVKEWIEGWVVCDITRAKSAKG